MSYFNKSKSLDVKDLESERTSEFTFASEESQDVQRLSIEENSIFEAKNNGRRVVYLALSFILRLKSFWIAKDCV